MHYAVQATASGKGQRRVTGLIYFTNDTPDNVEQFPIELFSLDKKHMVAATRPDHWHTFQLKHLKPAKYLLKFNWPNRCVLWYRVNLTKQSYVGMRIIMDLACAHSDGSIQDLPEN
jgi:hypothetical protein